ncbi:hypothetical protein E1B28_005277 [Marasmius oreades]|uniref:Extracellular serine-rich protein n=1 Tax=Marasmius oreades TaxID=181124 RepID=A0A9P7V0F0_9AGAR|nr:uncharacterized protein E1B28_005277 [Marasmius oreades]KAG7097967.1 hypothetical protein E1B28_005277 [Marasmius oreades]
MLNAVLLAVAAAPVMGKNFAVTVGANNDFIFLPNQISGARAGDTITFTFVSRNHSATTTTFVNPCPPPPGGVGPDQFDTGFNPTTATDHPVQVITLRDSGTHFVACMQAAGAHCHMGMTFAVNPTADQTYDEFSQNALNDPIQTF